MPMNTSTITAANIVKTEKVATLTRTGGRILSTKVTLDDGRSMSLMGTRMSRRDIARNLNYVFSGRSMAK